MTNNLDDKIGKILEFVFETGFEKHKQIMAGKGSNTYASDRMYQAKAAIKQLIVEAEIKLCGNIVKDFNNAVANHINDKDIDRHEFVVGLLWGTVAAKEVQLEQEKK